MINLKANDYYTQRNNTGVTNNGFSVPAHSACMPTSRVMFYIANNIPFINESGKPHDVYFTELLLSDEAVEFAKNKYPWAVKDGKLVIPPCEIHGMYGSWLDEKVTGRRQSDFILDLTFESVVKRIKMGITIMTSGTFGKIKGHVFCLTGYDGTNLLMADPYGDFHTDYKSHKGYAVKMSKEEFIEHVKPKPDKKWGHVLL